MHNFLNNLHSYNRYFLLAAIIFVFFRAVSGWLGKRPYQKLDNTASAILVGLAHLQLLLGLIQFFGTSAYTTQSFGNMGAAMKNEWQRYFTVEHSLMMILAVLFIQLGRTYSKRATDSVTKHRKLAIFTGIAVLLILGSLVPKGLLIGRLGE